ncbi:hypothetical protein A3709_20355 [Halioglobus sp. HI00S01]|uniref:hypothetical protein n=1 Tax=Halioglobus sp. HI00S01 TaxID=1822214 RepID=UPI0007C264F8|nr:hypothetical protein [Halioglobus sp. HI00S01]KZX57966.1 hypothetical protein A3709_20355 [Halioglobus sp. HI00S01]
MPKWTEDTIRAVVNEQGVTSRTQLFHEYPRAYGAARKRYPGLLDDLLPVKVRTPSKWTEETIRALVDEQGITSRTQLDREHPGAYAAARLRYPDLLDDLFPKNITEWTEDTIRAVVNEQGVTSRKQLFHEYPGAYDAARKRYPDLLDEVLPRNLPPHKWTEDAVRSVVAEEGLTSRAELRRKHPGAYGAARKRYPDLLDKLFPKNITEWTEDTIRALVDEHGVTSRKQLQREHSGAYYAARKRYPDLLDELLPVKVRTPSKWTEETIRALVDEQGITSRKQLQREHSGAYEAAHTRYPDLLDELLPVKGRTPSKWTEETIRALVDEQGITSRKQLQREHSGAYEAAHTRYPDLLDELLPVKGRTPSKWTEETIRALVDEQGITSRKQLQREHSGAYEAAHTRYPDLLDDLLRRSKWTEDTIRAVVDEQGITSRTQLQRESLGAYAAARLRYPDLLDELLPVKVRTPSKWTEETIRALVDEQGITSRGQLDREHPGAYEAAHTRYPDLLDELLPVKVRTPSKWTEETICALVDKQGITSRGQLQREHPSAYQAALKRYPDLLDELLPVKVRTPSKWTEETIRAVVDEQGITSRKQLQREHSGAYQTALKRYPDLLDELLPKKNVAIWTEGAIRALVDEQGVTSRGQLQRENPSAYQTALKRYPDLLDELLPAKVRTPSKWTEETIRALVDEQGITSRKQLQREHPGAYKAAIQRYPDLLDDLLRRSKWTEDTIRAVVDEQGITSRKQLDREHPGAYGAALKRYPGLLDDLFPETTLSPNKWTEDTIRALFDEQGITSRGQLQREHSGAYAAALKRYPDLLDEFLPGKIRTPYKWTEETIRALVDEQDITSRGQLDREHPGAYAAACLRYPDLLDDLLRRSKWTEDTIRAVVDEQGITSRTQLQRANPGAYAAARSRYSDLLDELLPKKNAAIWTEGDIRALVDEHGITSRGQLYRVNPRAHQAAIENFPALLDELLRRSKWTEDTICALVDKQGITSRGQLQREHSGAYEAARKRYPDLLDELLPLKKTVNTPAS